MWIYGLISLVVLIVSFFLFKKAAGTMSIHRINIVSWVFYFHIFLQSFVGINLVFVFNVHHYLMSRASSQSLMMAYVAVCYTMIMMPLAMIFAQKYFFGGKIKEKTTIFYAAKIVPVRRIDRAQIIFWLSLSFLALLATAYTYYCIETPPFVALFTSDISSTDFARLRIDAKQGFDGNEYVQNIFSKVLAPLVSYVAYGYLQLRKTKKFKLWFYFSMLVAVLAITYSGEKAPIIQYLLTLFFIRSFVDGGFRIGKLFTITLVTCAFIYFLYSSIGGSNSLILAINSGPIGRILLTQIAGLPLHFEVFPRMIPFLDGASFPNWISSTVFGSDSLRSARAIVQIYNPAGIEAGTAGLINTLFIAEAWANFGWFGFFIAPIWVGIVIQFIYNGLISLPKTPLSIAPMGYFLFKLGLTGGFVGFVWNATWLALFVIIMFGVHIFPVMVGYPKVRPNRISF